MGGWKLQLFSLIFARINFYKEFMIDDKHVAGLDFLSKSEASLKKAFKDLVRHRKIRRQFLDPSDFYRVRTIQHLSPEFLVSFPLGYPVLSSPGFVGSIILKLVVPE